MLEVCLVSVGGGRKRLEILLAMTRDAIIFASAYSLF